MCGTCYRNTFFIYIYPSLSTLQAGNDPQGIPACLASLYCLQPVLIFHKCFHIHFPYSVLVRKVPHTLTSLADEEIISTPASGVLRNLSKVTELQLGSRSSDLCLKLHLTEQSLSTASAELQSSVAVHQSQKL